MFAGLAIGLCRHRHAAGGGDRFEPDGDVDPIPEYLVLVGDHISHVDADETVHGAFHGQMVVSLPPSTPASHYQFDRADDAWKFQQETVARVLHEPAAVIENDGMDRAAMGLEGGVRAFLVDAQ